MTTIAYKDGVIAYDSRETDGNTILSDETDKRFERGGVNFFVCGKYCDAPTLMDAWFNPELKLTGKESIGAYVVDQKGVVWRVGINESDGFWRSPARSGTAIGSGQDHAFTAMDLGHPPEEGVRCASLRDTGTGGTIRTFKICP